jgi:predicted kinase
MAPWFHAGRCISAEAIQACGFGKDYAWQTTRCEQYATNAAFLCRLMTEDKAAAPTNAVRPQLVLFIGLPGSGKSTYYERHLASTHLLVSKDKMPNNRRPEARQQLLVREALLAGKSVVVDNTNPSVQSRAALLDIGRSAGAELIAFFFDVPMAVCIERNRKRTGKAKVPDVAIYVTAAKLRAPEAEEGFDRVHVVNAAGEAT